MPRAHAAIALALTTGILVPGPAATQSSATATVTATTTAAVDSFRVTRRFVLGGEGGWDYLVVDPATGRLFLSRSTHVMVVDPVTGRQLGDIPNTMGVHGVALVSSQHQGFTSNGRDSSVTIFDLASLATIQRIPIPARNPDAIIYDSASNRVFTFNGGSATATAIAPGGGEVLGTVALGGKPEAAVGDGRGRIYVNIEDLSEMVVFDGQSLRVASTWPLPGCEEPTGLAMDRVTRRLFVGCGNRVLAVVDADAGRVVATLPVGAGVDGVAFEPSTHLIFVSAGEGTLTVAKEAPDGSVTGVANVPTQRGARTLALNAARHEVYVVSAEFGPAPEPTAANPRPRPTIVPGSFTLLVVSSQP